MCSLCEIVSDVRSRRTFEYIVTIRNQRHAWHDCQAMYLELFANEAVEMKLWRHSSEPVELRSPWCCHFNTITEFRISMMATLLVFTLGWGLLGLYCVQSVSISYELKVEQELRYSENFEHSTVSHSGTTSLLNRKSNDAGCYQNSRTVRLELDLI